MTYKLPALSSATLCVVCHEYLSAQAKVLRALQEGKITRVGADKDISVDVRVIAATNKDLLKEVDEKNFRLDLYHRLGVIIIHVPSLNERRDDIPTLVDHFAEIIASEYGQPKKDVDATAMEALKKYDWTGNIRELRNVVERLIILSGKTITLDDVENYVFAQKIIEQANENNLLHKRVGSRRKGLFETENK